MFDWLGDFGDWLGDSWDSVSNNFSNFGDSLSNMFGGGYKMPAADYANGGLDAVAGSSILPGEWDWMKGGSLGGLSIPGLPSMIGGLAQYMQGNSNSNKTADATNRAVAAADPFAGQRPQYQEMLRQLYTNPDYLKSIPGFGAGMNAGTEAIRRNAAKSGRLDSGNVNYDLLDYGNKYAMDQFNTQAKQLGALSGADINGGSAAASAIQQGNLDAQKQSAYGLQALFNPWKIADAKDSLNNAINNYGNGL